MKDYEGEFEIENPRGVTVPEAKPPVVGSAHDSADSWRVHILGPDDLIPMESELHALREANMLNIGMARVRLKRPNDPNMPWCMAVVERNGIEYTGDPLKPSASLLIKLGSVIVHQEEMMSKKGHHFDKAALDTVRNDPEVIEWLSTMTKMAFLPVKR